MFFEELIGVFFALIIMQMLRFWMNLYQKEFVESKNVASSLNLRVIVLKNKTAFFLTYRFSVFCQIDVSGCSLALVK